jgi:hypothetical protein
VGTKGPSVMPLVVYSLHPATDVHFGSKDSLALDGRDMGRSFLLPRFGPTVLWC